MALAVSYTNESQQIKVGAIVFPSCCFTEDFWLLVPDSFKKLGMHILTMAMEIAFALEA